MGRWISGSCTRLTRKLGNLSSHHYKKWLPNQGIETNLSYYLNYSYEEKKLDYNYHIKLCMLKQFFVLSIEMEIYVSRRAKDGLDSFDREIFFSSKRFPLNWRTEFCHYRYSVYRRWGKSETIYKRINKEFVVT